MLNWTKDYFAHSGVDSPRLAAEMLLSHVLGCQRIELYARFSDEPAEDLRARFRELVRRAADGEPVAYLVGVKEFYSLPIAVTPDVLIPRPETELLVSQAIDHVKSIARPGRCWDVCTGSGCVALAVASNLPEAAVIATDISNKALSVAQANAETLRLTDRVSFAEADLLDAPADLTAEPFDVITANPPYVADADELGPTVDREPELALRAGADGLDILRRLIPQSGEHLADGGALIVEFGLGQADDVRDMIVATGLFDEPVISRDHQNIERTARAIRL